MKLWRFVKGELLFRRLPHGVISPYYLLPGQRRQVGIHRQLWLRALPRVPRTLFIFMEGFLYLRWVFFFVWKSTYRAVKRRGPGVMDRDGARLSRQFMTVLSMAVLYTIPPSEIYEFGLHRPGRRQQVWDYVFTHELLTFHRWRDRQHGRNGQSVPILRDKMKTAEILSRHGVSVVPTLAATAPGDQIDLSPWLALHPRLFLKPRCGSASLGCYVVEREQDGNDFGVFGTKSGMAISKCSRQHFFERIGQEPYLIQPLLANHPELAVLCESRDAITIRIITEAPNGKPVRCDAAMLEIPGPTTGPSDENPLKANQRFHVILSIDLAQGKTLPWNAGEFSHTLDTHYQKWYAMAENREIPFWNRLKESAVAAHALFRDVYAIAWDYVVTDDGPILLEGNTGWGTQLLQVTDGGLLR